MVLAAITSAGATAPLGYPNLHHRVDVPESTPHGHHPE
jgi:hypothetical protein